MDEHLDRLCLEVDGTTCLSLCLSGVYTNIGMMIGLGQHVAAGNLRTSANLVVQISCVKGKRERECVREGGRTRDQLIGVLCIVVM